MHSVWISVSTVFPLKSERDSYFQGYKPTFLIPTQPGPKPSNKDYTLQIDWHIKGIGFLSVKTTKMKPGDKNIWFIKTTPYRVLIKIIEIQEQLIKAFCQTSRVQFTWCLLWNKQKHMWSLSKHRTHHVHKLISTQSTINGQYIICKNQLTIEIRSTHFVFDRIVNYAFSFF